MLWDDAVPALGSRPACLRTERQGTAGRGSATECWATGWDAVGRGTLPAGDNTVGPTSRNLDASACVCLRLMSAKTRIDGAKYEVRSTCDVFLAGAAGAARSLSRKTWLIGTLQAPRVDEEAIL